MSEIRAKPRERKGIMTEQKDKKENIEENWDKIQWFNPHYSVISEVWNS